MSWLEGQLLFLGEIARHRDLKSTFRCLW
jgi:hypothetical protein